MSDEYFKKLDQKIGASQQQEVAKQSNQEQVSKATREFITYVRPTFERYKSELEKRGFDVKLTIAGHEGDLLSFELSYSHGGHYGFQIREGKIVPSFTEQGKSYCGGEGQRIGGMKTDAIERLIETTVDDFMLHSAKEGGWKKIY